MSKDCFLQLRIQILVRPCLEYANPIWIIVIIIRCDIDDQDLDEVVKDAVLQVEVN